VIFCGLTVQLRCLLIDDTRKNKCSTPFKNLNAPAQNLKLLEELTNASVLYYNLVPTFQQDTYTILMRSLLINRWILGLRFSLTSNGLHRSHCEKSEPLRYLVSVSLKNISPTLLENIYKSFVRPICDYAASVGNPYFARDIHSLEQTQCRFTKLSPAIKDLPYEERLVALHLSPMSNQ
jgi:hypothetical protein